MFFKWPSYAISHQVEAYQEDKVLKRVTKNLLGKIGWALFRPAIDEGLAAVRAIHDQQFLLFLSHLKASASNPLNKVGEKHFSQNDEDGITLEILRRIGITSGTFAEFGVGEGLENNTLILLAHGFRGFWIGGEEIAFDHNGLLPFFAFLKYWIDKDNVLSALKQGLELIQIKTVDLISIDLDGNDIYFAEQLLQSGINAMLYIVEYNAKYPPPIRWKIEYDKAFKWSGDDYFGASLASFNDLFTGYGYTLIACNLTGVNAFFIRNDLLDRFTDVSRHIEELYFPPRYFHLFQADVICGQSLHKRSPKTVERMLRSRRQD